MARRAGRATIRRSKEVTMQRKLLWAVLAIGLALVVVPFALGLPGKSAAGQRMLDGFHPIMQPGQVQITANYYDNVFVPLGHVTPMMSAQSLARFRADFAGVRMSPAAQRDFGALMGAIQANVGVFSQVPAGLAHYEPLVRTMQANVDNYKQVDSLPDFRLFTVFFVVPGALLVLLAGYGLFGGPAARSVTFRRHARPTPA
jgi:hypothetical protein